jgi:hypothetical protein
MRWRRFVALIVLVGLTMLVGGCGDGGTGVAGPVPKDTAPARSGEDRPAAKDKTSDSSPRLGAIPFNGA